MQTHAYMLMHTQTHMIALELSLPRESSSIDLPVFSLSTIGERTWDDEIPEDSAFPSQHTLRDP